MIFKARISLRSVAAAVSAANFEVERFLTLWTAPESLLRRLEPVLVRLEKIVASALDDLQQIIH